MKGDGEKKKIVKEKKEVRLGGKGKGRIFLFSCLILVSIGHPLHSQWMQWLRLEESEQKCKIYFFYE